MIAAEHWKCFSMVVLARTLLLAAGLCLFVSAETEPVQVHLYAEAGCPYCAHFTVSDVAPLFHNGISDLMDFRYIAWGNARNNTGPVRDSENWAVTTGCGILTTDPNLTRVQEG